MSKKIQHEKPAVKAIATMPLCIICGDPFVSRYVDDSGRALSPACDECEYNTMMDELFGPIGIGASSALLRTMSPEAA